MDLVVADLGIKDVKRCALDDDLSEVVILVAIANTEPLGGLTSWNAPVPCDLDGNLTIQDKLNLFGWNGSTNRHRRQNLKIFWRLRDDIKVGGVACLERLAILNKRILAGVVSNSIDRVEHVVLLFNRQHTPSGWLNVVVA